MEKITLTVTKDKIKLSKFVEGAVNCINHSYFLRILENKDIKINGKRTKTDEILAVDDVVEVFFDKAKIPSQKIRIIHQDDDILIAFKPRKISSEAFFEAIENELKLNLIPCQRLDTNTDGLMLFAKNDIIFKLIKDGFSNGYIEKKYLAVVVGDFVCNKTLTAYLLKDSEKGTVKVYDKEVKGSQKIVTGFNSISSNEGKTLVEVALNGGKTHQIRAHLAHLGYPILGDTKYGNFSYNKLENKGAQQLTAYKISFKFPKDSKLSSLNATAFEIKPDFLT